MAIPNEIDKFCNSCKNFDRIIKGKAMAGYCSKHKIIVDANKQFQRTICPYYSRDLGRMVIDRKQKFQLEKDCWIKRCRGTEPRLVHTQEKAGATPVTAKKHNKGGKK